MLEKFHHILPDGYELKLPKFENVPAGVLRKTRRMTDLDQAFSILEELMTEEDLEHVDLLDRNGLNDFLKAWRDGSAVDPGESSASSS